MDIGGIGGQLRAAREAQNLSVTSLAQRTRVQPRILAAIELNDLASIPPKPFGRGFVRVYAREVGLDPEATVRQYFAQFAPAPGEPVRAHSEGQNAGHSSGLLWPATGIAIVAVLVTLAMVRTPIGEDRIEPGAIGTTGRDRTSAATGEVGVRPAVERADPGPTPVVQASTRNASPSSEGLTVFLAAERDCWITATADGERVLFRMLRQGHSETIRAAHEITVRAGDAGAVTLAINDGTATALGRAGEVRTVHITPENTSSIR
jgi:cytoskeleton protein RodZ